MSSRTAFLVSVSLCLGLTIGTIAGVCGDPDAGSCFEPHPTPGCAFEECCELICLFDPFCCDVRWDEICVGLANTFCEFPPGGNCGNADGIVDESDIAALFDQWGTDGPCDLNFDGTVDTQDLLLLLGDWTVAPK